MKQIISIEGNNLMDLWQLDCVISIEKMKNGNPRILVQGCKKHAASYAYIGDKIETDTEDTKTAHVIRNGETQASSTDSRHYIKKGNMRRIITTTIVFTAIIAWFAIIMILGKLPEPFNLFAQLLFIYISIYSLDLKATDSE